MKPEWSKIKIKQYKYQVFHTQKKQKNKSKNSKDREGRLINTKEYAIAWGVINKPYSVTDLYKKCLDEYAPSFSFITRKCWKGYPRYYNDLVKAGMQPRPPRTDMQKRRMLGKISRDGFRLGILEKDYQIAKLAAQFGITTKKSYVKLRKQKPELKVFLPSAECIIRRFGTWKRFSYEMMKYNTDLVLTQYVTKSAEAGHWLRLKECDKLKIPIRRVMDILRPQLFNVLCYKKLTLMGLRQKITEIKREQKKK